MHGVATIRIAHAAQIRIHTFLVIFSLLLEPSKKQQNI